MEERLPDQPTSDRGALRRRLRSALITLTAFTALLTAPAVALADDAPPQQADQPTIEQPAGDAPVAAEPSATDTIPAGEPAVEAPVAEPAVEAPAPEQPVGDTQVSPTGEIPTPEPTTEEPPVETPPVEQPPVEEPPVETPPVETPPVEQPPVETPPVETPPVETPPVEQPAGEQPAPVEPAPVEPAPVEETPTVEETPADDKPARDSRPAPAETNATVSLPKPATGSGVLRPALTDASPTAAPVTEAATQTVATPPALDPVVSAPLPLPGSRRADDQDEAAADAAARNAAAKRIVRKTLVNLGIVPATPVAATSQVTPATADSLICAPVVVSAAVPTPDSSTTRLQVAKSVRKQHAEDQPSSVRGPPVGPFDSPSSPLNASAAAAAGNGSAAGISFFAVLVGSVSAQLAQAEAVAPPCSFASNSATPTSDDSARAPPIA
ncbi:hypothetical protein [Conexibacter stalactiti]|uniref:hypothetical protein n=1 Tax=Conexibacter stalactiti TaxID=1940611 RepID=UPI00298BF135|nr:hypothetical protein [Conexibacter stalactiti]